MDGKKPLPPEPVPTGPSSGTDSEGQDASSPTEAPRESAGPPDDGLTLEEADPSQVEWVEVEEIKDEQVHENKPEVKEEEKAAVKEGTADARPEDGRSVPPEAEVVEEMKPLGPGLLNGKRGMGNGRNGVPGRNGNGLINGKGHINGEGLGRRQSLVNGNGLVNGRGLVNGKGLVNGMREKEWRDGPDGGQGGRYSRAMAKRDRTRRVAKLAVGSVIVLMLLTAIPAYMYLKEASEGMLVDGRFSDWSDVMMYEDGKDTNITFGELDIVEYSMAEEGRSLFFYLKVAGEMMAGEASAEGVDVVNVYIDTDGQEGTGFTINGIGADALIEIYGFNHIVHGRVLYKFDDERDRRDWNGWVATGSTSSALSGNRMEMSFPMSDLRLSDARNAIVLFQVLSTFSDEGDLSEAMIGLGRASLVLEQGVLSPDIIPQGSAGTPFLGIRLEAKGGDVSLGSLTLTRDGDATDADTGPVVLKGEGGVQVSSAFTGGDGALTFPMSLGLAPGGRWVANILVDVPKRSMGHDFGLEVLGPENVSAGDAVVTLVTRTSMKNVYLGRPPARIVIDGAFGDWEGVPTNADPGGDAVNPNVDIRDTRAVKGDGTISFYVKVDGTVMAGVPTPVRLAKMVPSGPSGPSGPPGPPITPPPLPELVAADVVRIFIDTDNLPITGCPIIGMDMGADIALVVTGVDGRILDQQMFGWSIIHDDWSLFGTFEAANDADRMELQAPMEVLGITANSTIKAMVFATDWEDNNDTSDSPIIVIDPLQLNRTGEINFSSDGNTWTYQTDLGAKTFVDMTVDASGYVYALANDGTVYRSTGDWTLWTQIINNYGASTGFIAIDTDSGSPQWFFALATNGSIYNSTGTNWAYRGDVGGSTDYIDMCWSSGKNTSATLYVIRSRTAARVRTSTNGGANWANYGNQNVGRDGSTETNVGIVNGTAWGANYLFVLQSDGDVRVSRTGSWWTRIATPATDTYSDLDYATGGVLWVVTTRGQTYKFTSSGSTAGGGSWNTLGNTSMGAVSAIAVGEIPEFRDVLIPIVGMVAIIIFMRRGKIRGARARPGSRTARPHD